MRIFDTFLLSSLDSLGNLVTYLIASDMPSTRPFPLGVLGACVWALSGAVSISSSASSILGICFEWHPSCVKVLIVGTMGSVHHIVWAEPSPTCDEAAVGVNVCGCAHPSEILH